MTEFNGYTAREYFWGCKFTSENPVKTWSFAEEDDDEDFMSHTLYLKQATLDPQAAPNENHVLQVETTDFDGEEIKIAIVNLNTARNAMTNLDLSFDHKSMVTFRLVSGSGPIDLAATHLVEFPEDMPEDTELEDTEGEDREIADTLLHKNGKSAKRKASAALKNKKTKRGKKEEDSEEGDDSEDERDDDMDDEDDDDDDSDEELESSPEVKKGKAKKGAKAKNGVEKKKSKVTEKGKKGKSK